MKLAQFSTLQTRKAVLTSLTWTLLVIVVVSWQCKASSTQLRNSEAFVFLCLFEKINNQIKILKNVKSTNKQNRPQRTEVRNSTDGECRNRKSRRAVQLGSSTRSKHQFVHLRRQPLI